MINVHQLIHDFKLLTYEQQRQKVINFLQAIYDRTQQFGEILDLVKKVNQIPGQILLDIYTSLVTYGNDMNNIRIKEKMGETAYKLQLIWEREAKLRVEEEKELRAMEKKIEDS